MNSAIPCANDNNISLHIRRKKTSFFVDDLKAFYDIDYMKATAQEQIKAEILKDTAFIIAAKYAVKAAKQKTFAGKKFMREISALFSQIGRTAP